MVWLSTEILQGWFMLQESVFHSELTPFNETALWGIGLISPVSWGGTWCTRDGHIRVDLWMRRSLVLALTLLFPRNLLIYCFILLTVTHTRAWLTYLLSKTFYSLIVAVFHPQHRRKMPRKRTPGKLSMYKASPQHAGASKGQGVSQDGIIKGHQEPHSNVNHIRNAILWFYGL